MPTTVRRYSLYVFVNIDSVALKQLHITITCIKYGWYLCGNKRKQYLCLRLLP